MFKLAAIFSVKGLLTISILTFLFWLLQQYPEWRAQRKAETTEAITKTFTTPEGSRQNEQKKEEKKEKQEKKEIENLSLAHYILVTPFAALYIICKALIDTIRYSLYYILWSCEKSIPLIDDWLFEKVTITLPTKYNDFTQWWIEEGQPKYNHFKAHFRDNTLPSIVENLELFFTKVYEMSCIIQSCMLDFIEAWKRFVQRHDWKQLATDLSNIAFIIFWNPLVWIVTRTFSLGRLIYYGMRSATISIKNDITWISTVLIPTVYNYISSTVIAKKLCSGTIKLMEGIQKVTVNVYRHLLVPTIGRSMNLVVNTIDRVLVVLLQSKTLQEKVKAIYRYAMPNLVWTIFECSSLVTEILTWVHLVFTQVVHPAYILFMRHVVPCLAIAYQSIIVQWMFELHLYPAWLAIYPYLNAPLFWSYTHLISPVVNNLYSVVTSITHYVTQYQLAQLRVLMAKVVAVTQAVYGGICSWLSRQAPILSNMIGKLSQMVANSCDWNGLSKDALLLANLFYDWISVHSNKIYLSLERTLTVWAEEQEENKNLKLKRSE